MTELTLSLAAAPALHLAAQGLSQPRRRKARRSDVLDAIRQMGVLQIDTIQVVARSPYLAFFVPIEHYGLFQHRMLNPEAMRWKYSATSMKQRRVEVEAVLSHIRVNGPTRSSDFERSDGQAGARISERFTRDIAGALQRLANWHACPQIRITQATPDSSGPVLQAAFGAADQDAA